MQYFHVVLPVYCALQRGLTFKSVDESLEMKAMEQYFHLVLFITLYKVVLTFTSVDETLVCDNSNESY